MNYRKEEWEKGAAGASQPNKKRKWENITNKKE